MGRAAPTGRRSSSHPTATTAPGAMARARDPVRQLAGDLLPDLPRVITRLDLEIQLQELDDRQISGSFSVGDGAALEHQPTVRAMRVDELPIEAGLTDPRLAHDSYNLAAAGLRALERLVQLLHLRSPPDELREPT